MLYYLPSIVRNEKSWYFWKGVSGAEADMEKGVAIYLYYWAGRS